MSKRNDNSKDIVYYPVVCTDEEGKEIAVEIPDLDVATSGIDDEDAFMSARELLGLTIFGLEEDGDPVPSPSSMNSNNVEENQRVMLVDAYMPAVRMAENNRSVSRTVTLPAWLNAKALNYNINFSQVLQDALKAQLPV